MPEGVAEVPQSLVEQIVENCYHILDAGFDYTEVGASMLYSLTDEEVEALAKADAERSLCLYAANSLFLPELDLSNPAADREKQTEYIHKVTDRLSRFGVKYAVFGSGGARSIPEGVSEEEGRKALYRFMNEFIDYAAPRGVTMVIEPLRRRESNIFVTVPECAAVVREFNREGLSLLCDSFHMSQENTPVDAVYDAVELIKHCHMSEAPDRTCPGTITTGDPAYNKQFAACLNKVGFTGGVSAECSFADFKTDVPVIYAYMKKIFTEKEN
ncbi:MAG: sugar phosphate isomerase/epimerase [Clostridia bacterium]|nr:sugar phosphate isomerase/epimerase [Clostridia bacterium]